MQDICTYRIEVRDKIDENAFNATSPLRIAVVQVDPASTLFTICTDQSGLIGLIRHLHGHGFVLLSIYRERQTAISGEKQSFRKQPQGRGGVP